MKTSNPLPVASSHLLRSFHEWGLAFTFFLGVHIYAQPVGDDFNDNTKDSSKWGMDISPATPGGQLVEANSRLEYYSTEGGQITFKPWVFNYGSYTQDWEAVTDLNIGNVVLSQNSSDAQMFMDVMKKDGFGSRDVFSIGLMVYKIDSTHFGRLIRCTLSTNGSHVLVNELNTAAPNVSVRITFDSANKTLRAWYDGDGSGNGYSWTLVSSGRIDNAQSTWRMTNGSLFQVYLSGNSENLAVNSSHQLFADNFAMQVAYPLLVTTGPATGISSSSATLKGTVNPNGLATTAQFEYGLTTNYGSRVSVTLSPNNGSTAQPVSATLDGLQAGTTYHFRVVATNSDGAAPGSDATFTTTAPPPQLQATRFGPQLVFSWLTNGPYFVLETSSNLAAGAVWHVVTNGVVISGDRFWVTNQPVSNAGFYRLRL